MSRRKIQRKADAMDIEDAMVKKKKKKKKKKEKKEKKKKLKKLKGRVRIKRKWQALTTNPNAVRPWVGEYKMKLGIDTCLPIDGHS